MIPKRNLLICSLIPNPVFPSAWRPLLCVLSHRCSFLDVWYTRIIHSGLLHSFFHSRMFSVFIHVCYVSQYFVFVVRWVSFLWIYHIFSVCCLWWTVGLFPLLAAVSNVIWTFMWVIVWTCFPLFLGCIPKTIIAESRLTVYLTFWGTVRLFSKVAASSYVHAS